ncbi:superoxide dismutase [Mn/Fe] [Nitrosarchaeum sp.]|nr:superoxide dismutase [Mn/Fe] [Nitrosarchaeum sp.]
MVKYELPRLPYGYDELEPHIDTQTMEIHHQKHHQAYVDGLNKTLAKISSEFHPQYITSVLFDLTAIPESVRSEVNFFGGGFENHKLFWETMTPKMKEVLVVNWVIQLMCILITLKILKKNFQTKPCPLRVVDGVGLCSIKLLTK